MFRKRSDAADPNRQPTEYYKDQLFPDAVEVTLETRCVSAGRLQSALRIGSIRAKALLAELEEHGIIGPERGNRPREIFYTMERWNEEKRNFVHITPPESNPACDSPNGKNFCPHCKKAVPSGARICWRCGKKVSDKPISASEAIIFLLILFIALMLFLPLTFRISNRTSSTSSSQIPDTVVYDDSDITLYASAIYYGDDYPSINFLVENKASENIGFYCSSFIVDNVMMDSNLWIDVAKDSKATGTLYLDYDVLNRADFDLISFIEFYEPHISFKESNRGTKYISVGLSFEDVSANDFDTSGEVLYSQNGVTVISRFVPGQYSRTIPLLIINESGKDITPWTSHVTVNGYTVSEWHYGVAIPNGTARYFDIQLVKESVEQTGIDSIYKASFHLSFLASGSTQELFSAGQLYVQ